MILDKLAAIDTFIFDVDGVFTTGTVLATNDGEMLRDFNIKDGFKPTIVYVIGWSVLCFVLFVLDFKQIYLNNGYLDIVKLLRILPTLF